MSILVKGKIEEIEYIPSKPVELPTISIKDFDVNKQKVLIVKTSLCQEVALSCWTGPKRTRTYPFASIYDIYGFDGKRVTVIPIIKDEGADTNNDRINYITLAWMNLLNIYIILAWYESAERKSPTRISNQKLNNDWVHKKIREISKFKYDANHWNNKHFEEDFCQVLNNAVESYRAISDELEVRLHNFDHHYENYINKFINSEDSTLISLSRFREIGLGASQMAAYREAQTVHELEALESDSEKPVIALEDTLGGKYYLTSDDLLFDGCTIIIQEDKNSTTTKLPSESDVKDGLFKLILYSNLRTVTIGRDEFPTKARLRLTGSELIGSLNLPDDVDNVHEFIYANHLSLSIADKLLWLNEEAKLNGFTVCVQCNE